MTQQKLGKCPECQATMKKVEVKIAGAKNTALSYQCTHCDYFAFDDDSSKKVIQELRETPLKIKQKIVKLSQDRIGMYFNTHVVRSLNLKKGEDIYVSVPDDRHMILEFQNES